MNILIHNLKQVDARRNTASTASDMCTAHQINIDSLTNLMGY